MSTLLSIKNLNVDIFSDKSILPVINNVNIRKNHIYNQFFILHDIFPVGDVN